MSTCVGSLTLWSLGGLGVVIGGWGGKWSLVQWLGGLPLVGFLILGSLSLFTQWCGTSKEFRLPPKMCASSLVLNAIGISSFISKSTIIFFKKSNKMEIIIIIIIIIIIRCYNFEVDLFFSCCLMQYLVWGPPNKISIPIWLESILEKSP
jgi:hypothetical protein